jgi:universal stress protein A
MTRMMHLLVPTDFSATSEIALHYALDIAPPGAAIHVLHVIHDASLMAAYPDGFYVEPPGQRERLIEEATARLTEIARTAARPNLTTEVVVGWPVGAIVQDAKLRDADLIVMGTHGRTGLAHALLGSVAERVLRTAPCPVLTVRDTSPAADALAEEAVAKRQAAHA